MAAIGSAALVLTASAGKLYEGLGQASSKIKSWAGGAASSVSGAFSKVGTALGALAVVGAIKNSFNAITNSIKEMGDQARAAKSLGIGSDFLMGLTNNAKLFGVEGDAVTKTLTKLGAKLAQPGGGELAKKLGGLGVSMDALQGKGIDEQFIALADAIKGMDNPAQQAAAAMALFEEEGLKLLPMLQQGGGAIKAFIDKQKSMGAALGESEMQGILRAKEALPQLYTAFTGLWNRIVAAAAPVIEVLASSLSGAVQTMGPLFTFVGDAAAAAFTVVTDIFKGVWEVGTSLVSMLGDLIGQWFNVSGQWPTGAEVVMGAFRLLGKGGAYVVDAIKAIGGAVSYVAGWATSGFGLIITAIRKVLEVAGKLPERLGGGYFRRAADSVRRFEEGVYRSGRGMREWGTSTIKGFGDGAKAVDDYFDDLERRRQQALDIKLQQPGKIGTPPGQAPQYQGVAALLQGSKEAYSVEARFKFGAMMKKPEEKQLAETKRTNEKLSAVVSRLERIEDRLMGKEVLGVV